MKKNINNESSIQLLDIQLSQANKVENFFQSLFQSTQNSKDLNYEHSSIINFQKEIGYKFSDISKLITALTHRSFTNESQNKFDHFEKLEFFGDAILDFIITEKLFKEASQLSEGQLSKLRSSLVNENILSTLAVFCNLHLCLLLGNGEFKNRGFLKKSILSDSFEAVICAVYLDGGLESAKKVVLSIFERYQKEKSIDLFSVDNLSNIDAKTTLQNWCMQTYGKLPVYESVENNGNFTVKLFIEDKLIAQNSGNSKKDLIKNLAQIAIVENNFINI